MAQRKLDLDRLPSNNQTTTNKRIELTGEIRSKPRGGIANKVRDIGNSLFQEIVVPALQDGAIEFLSEGFSRLIRGGSDTTYTRARKHTDYSGVYRNTTRRRPLARRAGERRTAQRVTHVFEDVYFDNRRDAENVLGKMMEFILEFGWVKVGDLYAMVGLPQDYIHEDWGWRDLHGTRVSYTNDGYLIMFDEPEYLK